MPIIHHKVAVNKFYKYTLIEILWRLITINLYYYVEGDSYAGIAFLWNLLGVSVYLDRTLNPGQAIHLNLGIRLWRLELTLKGTIWYVL